MFIFRYRYHRDLYDSTTESPYDYYNSNSINNNQYTKDVYTNDINYHDNFVDSISSSNNNNNINNAENEYYNFGAPKKPKMNEEIELVSVAYIS